MIRIAILLLFILSLASCHKSTTPTDTFSRNDFPMAVGDWWRYQVIDVNAPTDTLLMTVIASSGNGSTKDYTYTIYKNAYHRTVDTGHFIISDTGLSYNTTNPYYSYFGSFNLKLPFQKEQQWVGSLPHDTITAVGRAAVVKIMGKDYGPVYTLNRKAISSHYRNLSGIFVAPHIGIIYQDVSIEIDTAVPQKQTFLLIDYNLN
ncbi:MAG: hypothetical protein JWO03_3875 [Bacteroidetes bacterium]|nr:hypothetical protein [Bacteroidota bacterium]